MPTSTTTHTYRTVDVPVPGGGLRVGVWDPVDATGDVPDVLVVHGVTSSHLAWPYVVEELPGVRVIAPDLRGRGRSNELEGEAGMARHADDLVAVLDALGAERPAVAGHSMGGFVTAALAHRHPDRVGRLVLVDGGLPLEVPQGLAPEEVVAMILGPTAARLEMRFSSVEEYLDFWRGHPAFAGQWTPELEEYLEYDLVPAEDGLLRSATSYRTTVDDTVDMNTGTTLAEAIAALPQGTVFVWVPRGLQDETPGLYAPAHRDAVLAGLPQVRPVLLGDHNHYTVVLGRDGARALGPVLREAFSLV